MSGRCTITDCLSVLHASDLSRVEKLRLEVEIRQVKHALTDPNAEARGEASGNDKLMTALCEKLMHLHKACGTDRK